MGPINETVLILSIKTGTVWVKEMSLLEMFLLRTQYMFDRAKLKIIILGGV